MQDDTMGGRSWHALDREQVMSSLATRADGLSEVEAKRRLGVYGYNQIAEESRPFFLHIFAKQFKEPLVLILLSAAVIAALLGERTDAAIISTIVVLASIVGFVQEFRSEKAIAALRAIAAPTCRVIRGGKETTLDVKLLVPGDIIAVSAGDKVSADSYIIESFNLQVDQAPLTGESVPVRKDAGVLPQETQVADRFNILHTVTAVTYGRGRAVVFATGMNTQLGKIASAVQSITVQKTPFEKKMRRTGKVLSIMMLAVVGIVSIVGLARGHEVVEMLLWGVSLAVAAVPEALPAVIATSLTLGVYQMAKRNAIVRRLPAVESLGSTTIICCDKTGTLTRGEMTVRQVYVYDTTVEVTGLGYSLEGSVAEGIEKNDLEVMAKCATLCNDATVRTDDGKVVVTGDPTEAALLVLAAKTGVDSAGPPRVHEIPFTSERKRMTTVHRAGDGYVGYTKGAAEVVLARCSKVCTKGEIADMNNRISSRILAVNNEMASAGLRVLALAYKHMDNPAPAGMEDDLVFIGLAAMMDPPRTESIDAVAQCKDAGIRVVMITGDHRLTASAVAKEIGITAAESVTGEELDRMSVDDVARRVEKIGVYSRVSPEHKLKIVQALKSKGHIVAMTGDGTNDAPALKASDIGVAMGITGTQVAKESSSMVLADDNFATIVMAVREGRRIIDNVKKYLVYLLSANLSEITLLTFAIAMGWPFPLLAKHILYINLATDGSPAIALGMEPAEPGIMKRRPRDPRESIFAKTGLRLAGVSILMSAISILLFWSLLEQSAWQPEGVERARTMTFGLLVFFELFFALSCRSLTQNVTKLGILRNRVLVYSLLGESAAVLLIMNLPVTQELFGLVALGLVDWAIMLSLAALGFVCPEVTKAMKRRFWGSNAAG